MSELKGTKQIGKVTKIKTTKKGLILEGRLDKKSAKAIAAAQKQGVKFYVKVGLKKTKAKIK